MDNKYILIIGKEPITIKYLKQALENGKYTIFESKKRKNMIIAKKTEKEIEQISEEEDYCIKYLLGMAGVYNTQRTVYEDITELMKNLLKDYKKNHKVSGIERWRIRNFMTRALI